MYPGAPCPSAHLCVPVHTRVYCAQCPCAHLCIPVHACVYPGAPCPWAHLRFLGRVSQLGLQDKALKRLSRDSEGCSQAGVGGNGCFYLELLEQHPSQDRSRRFTVSCSDGRPWDGPWALACHPASSPRDAHMHPQSPLHSSSKEAVYFPRAVLCIVGSRVRAHMALSRCLAHAATGHTAQSCPRLARTPPCHLACPGAGLGRPVQAVSRVPAGGTRGHPLWPQRFLSSVSCKVEPRDPGAELSRRQFRPRIGGGGVLGWGPAGSQDVLRGRAGQVLQAGILAPGVRPGPNDRALGLWTHRNSQYSRSSAGCDLGSLKKPV